MAKPVTKSNPKKPEAPKIDPKVQRYQRLMEVSRSLMTMPSMGHGSQMEMKLDDERRLLLKGFHPCPVCNTRGYHAHGSVHLCAICDATGYLSPGLYRVHDLLRMSAPFEYLYCFLWLLQTLCKEVVLTTTDNGIESGGYIWPTYHLTLKPKNGVDSFGMADRDVVKVYREALVTLKTWYPAI